MVAYRPFAALDSYPARQNRAGAHFSIEIPPLCPRPDRGFAARGIGRSQLYPHAAQSSGLRPSSPESDNQNSKPQPKKPAQKLEKIPPQPVRAGPYTPEKTRQKPSVFRLQLRSIPVV